MIIIDQQGNVINFANVTEIGSSDKEQNLTLAKEDKESQLSLSYRVSQAEAKGFKLTGTNEFDEFYTRILYSLRCKCIGETFYRTLFETQHERGITYLQKQIIDSYTATERKIDLRKQFKYYSLALPDPKIAEELLKKGEKVFLPALQELEQIVGTDTIALRNADKNHPKIYEKAIGFFNESEDDLFTYFANLEE